MPKPDVFLFNSRALRDQAGPHLQRACPRADQAIVYNAVDLTAFPATLPANRRTPRVGIIGNLSAVKGHDDFLRMARTLRDRGVSCEYWIVGMDITHSGYEKRLKTLADDLAVSDSVRFLGFRSDVAAVIQDLDVVVSTSHYESFGRTLIEAMACARPVVATAVGGVPEVVEEGVTGFLVPAHAPEALTERVGRLLRDRALRERMGRAGRARAAALFSQAAHAEHITRIYDGVLRHAAAARSPHVEEVGEHASAR